MSHLHLPVFLQVHQADRMLTLVLQHMPVYLLEELHTLTQSIAHNPTVPNTQLPSLLRVQRAMCLHILEMQLHLSQEEAVALVIHLIMQLIRFWMDRSFVVVGSSRDKQLVFGTLEQLVTIGGEMLSEHAKRWKPRQPCQCV